ncbi:hypothetical protein NDI44_05765 [Trichocoleus sp. DQ-A3]|uniref:hypothetical protein n=1 Tax=Cyanophyceae TaxID=3028117 RepID=UPI001682F230|nr:MULTISPECIES: hypothetical protein [unclassified Coleofasciculus]MBD1896976.1 hypothetical protein [Coleofasciculus sp. FACHB-129]MBD1901181.1 hypothetical protein [Coleofasciculus sp. FACHB-125]
MITAIIVVLKGSGVLKQLPDYVIWALVLFTLVAASAAFAAWADVADGNILF